MIRDSLQTTDFQLLGSILLLTFLSIFLKGTEYKLSCIFQPVDCPHLHRQYMFNEFFTCICIGFSEFNQPVMCKISHSHFFSIMLFVSPFRTEHSIYFFRSKAFHFVGGLKHKLLLIINFLIFLSLWMLGNTITF